MVSVPREPTPQMRAIFVTHETALAETGALSIAFDNFYRDLLAAAAPPEKGETR